MLTNVIETLVLERINQVSKKLIKAYTGSIASAQSSHSLWLRSVGSFVFKKDGKLTNHKISLVPQIQLNLARSGPFQKRPRSLPGISHQHFRNPSGLSLPLGVGLPWTGLGGSFLKRFCKILCMFLQASVEHLTGLGLFLGHSCDFSVPFTLRRLSHQTEGFVT